MREVDRYLAGYADSVREQVVRLIEAGRLQAYLLDRYSKSHDVKSDADLREFVMSYKNQYLKKSSPLSKVIYDNKIHVIKNALGTHSYVNRVQGSKIKSKNEIHISSVFKAAPKAFLDMIVVHELAHIKEKDHNKAFYQLCQHMLPDYHQLEFDMRLYLLQKQLHVIQ
ncbi:M48 family metallopeptidase [Oceaniserpentilla sp. 4NH20-0058]|uniref:M48 metallopeptidase family protein n=1 Tax=Oceaniserpentilla sp. 4NH20-0058 TaxID=3127660 RepID=UPI0031064568